MPPWAESGSPPVQAVLHRHGFERVLDVSTVPLRNANRIRYSTVVRAAGEDWCLRSAGLPFRIVVRSWVRGGPRRCYSVGWGLVGEDQSDRLLLAQAFGLDSVDGAALGAALTAELTESVWWVDWSVGEQQGQTCLSLAAELRHLGTADG